MHNNDEINVTDLTERTGSSPLQARVIGLCAAVAMIDGFDTQSIALVAPLIAEEWHLQGGAFGPVFSAGLLGVMVGQLILGPLADRYGRRKLILICTLSFGLFTLSTVLADGWTQLVVLRFLTGIGLGGAIPNIVALTAEYSPKRYQATMIMVMLCGFPIGAAVGGYISAQLVGTFGWQSIFYVGGIVPIGLFVLLAVGLPESIRFMVAANKPRDQIEAAIRRLSPELRITRKTRLIISEQSLNGSTFKHLFENDRTKGTLLIWVLFFMSLLAAYFLISWLPLALRESGLTMRAAISSVVILNVGGVVGAIALGRLMDRMNSHIVLTSAYAVAASCVLLIGFLGSQSPLLMGIVFLTGFCLIGGQIGINAVAANFYPTLIRATGVGVANGVGRFGSVVGPMIGSVLVAFAIADEMLLTFSALPAMAAGCAVFLLGYKAWQRQPTAIDPGA